MPAAADQASKAGIVISSTGERHIPASQRPDGSKRREIKIRPGYKPPEDVETYKNRTAEAWKTRGSSGVPGAAKVGEDDDDDDQRKGSGESKTSSKNAKRREARKKAKAAAEMGELSGGGAASQEGGKGEQLVEAVGDDAKNEGRDDGGGGVGVVVDGDGLAEQLQPEIDGKAPPPPPSSSAKDLEVEREKQARKAQKKLRQANDLKEKQDGGVQLQPAELEKVNAIDDLVRQLDQLGFRSNAASKEG